jgi:hypothetical protein
VSWCSRPLQSAAGSRNTFLLLAKKLCKHGAGQGCDAGSETSWCIRAGQESTPGTLYSRFQHPLADGQQRWRKHSTAQAQLGHGRPRAGRGGPLVTLGDDAACSTPGYISSPCWRLFPRPPVMSSSSSSSSSDHRLRDYQTLPPAAVRWSGAMAPRGVVVFLHMNPGASLRYVGCEHQPHHMMPSVPSGRCKG